MKKLLLVGMMCAAGMALAAPQGITAQAGSTLTAKQASVAVGLTQAEKASLYQMREEEKLAHDVYAFLYQKWQQPIFSRIAASEQQHTQAVAGLLARYRLADAAEGLGEGKFSQPDMQKLYTRLTQQGSQSLVEALKVGAEIEELDIDDLQKAGKDVRQADIARVYQNLTRGSRNHLRSFYGMLQQNRASYEPKYMSKEAFLQVANSERERGRPF